MAYTVVVDAMVDTVVDTTFEDPTVLVGLELP